MKNSIKLAKYFRYTSRTVLIIVSTFWFVFALLSGSREYGGGLKGIVMNSPNALPWVLVFISIYFTFKWELIGGSLIAVIGLFTMFFFNAFKSPFVLFAVSLPLLVFGGLSAGSWYLTKNKNIKKQNVKGRPKSS